MIVYDGACACACIRYSICIPECLCTYVATHQLGMNRLFYIEEVRMIYIIYKRQVNIVIAISGSSYISVNSRTNHNVSFIRRHYYEH